MDYQTGGRGCFNCELCSYYTCDWVLAFFFSGSQRSMSSFVSPLISRRCVFSSLPFCDADCVLLGREIVLGLLLSIFSATILIPSNNSLAQISCGFLPCDWTDKSFLFFKNAGGDASHQVRCIFLHEPLHPEPGLTGFYVQDMETYLWLLGPRLP